MAKRSFDPLSPAAFHILLALSDRDRHGYGIMREVAERTGGKLRLGPGTLYGAIQRLLAAGLIAECGEHRDPALGSERRRCYRLTAAGRRMARAEAERLSQLVEIARAKRLIARPHPA